MDNGMDNNVVENNTQVYSSDFTSGTQGFNEQGFSTNQSYNHNSYNSDLESPVTVGEWLISMLIMLIPCVNIVMIFVWAFGSSEKKSKSNYFKASLIMGAIGTVLYIVMIGVFMVLGMSTMNMMMY